MDIDFSKYSCKKKNMQYTIIGESIKKDFDFIKSDGAIAQKLDEMVNYLKNAAAITDGFYFENGGNVNDVNEAYEEIKTDVGKVKDELGRLHSAFMTDIDNINAELEVNFGHWVGYKVNGG